jgi:hypothetical protein
LNLDFRRFRGIDFGTKMLTLTLLKLSFRDEKVSPLSIAAALVLDSSILAPGCSSVKLLIVAGRDKGVSTWRDGSFTTWLCTAVPALSEAPFPASRIGKSRIFDIVFLGINCGILGLYVGCRCGMFVSEEYV